MIPTKPWRGPKFKKISDQDKEEIIRLREEGATIQSIADKYGVAYTTIYYHMNPKYKEAVKKRVYKSQKRIGSWTSRHPEERREYMRKYMNERYSTDSEFRTRILSHVAKYDKKMRLQNSKLKETQE